MAVDQLNSEIRGDASASHGVRNALVLSISFAFAGAFLQSQNARYILFLLAGGLMVGALFFAFRTLLLHRSKLSVAQSFGAVIAHDPVPKFIVGTDTNIIFRNQAAESAHLLGDTITEVVNQRVVNSRDIVERLTGAAQFEDTATETLTTRVGKTKLHVAVIQKDLCVWTVNDQTRSHDNHTAGPILPMLTTGRGGTVLFMNGAARDLLGERKTKLSDIFDHQDPNASDVNIISTANGLSRCFVLEKELSGDRKELFLIPTQGKEQLKSGMSFEEMPVAVLKTTRTGKVLLTNKAARHLLGDSLSKASHIADVMEGLGRPLNAWLSEAAEDRAQNLNEFLRLRRDDKEVFVQVTLGRIVEDGTIALFAVLNDATELKTLEAQFVQSQKMQAIGQLAGGVAHDFNNLLTAISGHCDLLLLRHEEGDADFADLTQIYQNANRAAGLVGQLLAYSRKQTLQPVTLDLIESLSDLMHLLNRLVGEKITLRVQHDPDVNPINVDRQQFEQVIMNLVVNARDAMPQGGEIEVITENLSFAAPQKWDRAVVPPGDYVSIRVSDQGSGISETNRQKVFEPFFTTKRTGEGTGLGLSTAYGIVKQSGGFIFVDSLLEEGTTFNLLFPTSEVALSSDNTTAEPAALPEGPADGVILLVEDEDPVRAFASRALRLKGFTVLEAANAEEALNYVQDDSLHFDLFVTDVVMPGKDGPTWVNEARQDRPNVRVVFMSGYAEETFSGQEWHFENSVFLPKPFSLAELTQVAQQQISHSA
ncbi:ATP-binding protein [Cognatishimia sp. WU-CL00825]|uniref:ATP-binding protein n=1 Tax=Cognatishimia sp. WU-CL00825 TaxID=3127658 RepID=UPI00310ADC8E